MNLTQDIINDFLRDFQEEHELNSVRAATMRSQHLFRWLNGRELNRQTVCEYVRECILPLKSSTAMHYQDRLLWILNWLVKMRKLPEVPFRPMSLYKGWKPTNKVTFSTEDYQRCITKALKMRDPVHRRGLHSDGGWRHYALVCAWNTGLRFIDVCYLRQEHILWNNKPFPLIQLVPVKTRKQGAEVNIPLRAELAECLKYYIAKFGESYIHPPLAKAYLKHGNFDCHFAVKWRRFFDALYLFDHTFHGLRHTFISRILNKGHQIQTVSGMTGQGYRTLQLYNHPSLQVAMDALDDSLEDGTLSVGDPPPTLNGLTKHHPPAETLPV